MVTVVYEVSWRLCTTAQPTTPIPSHPQPKHVRLYLCLNKKKTAANLPFQPQFIHPIYMMRMNLWVSLFLALRLLPLSLLDHPLASMHARAIILPFTA